MKEYFKSENVNKPSLISCIWKGGDISGIGGKPTGKFVIKMPPNNIFITLGSVEKMIKSPYIKNWYLLPLYNGKRKRVGYQYGVGMNHGQIPGYLIYKAFTKEEINEIIEVKETIDDYPLYLSNSSRVLNDIIGQQLTNRILIQSIINRFI